VSELEDEIGRRGQVRVDDADGRRGLGLLAEAGERTRGEDAAGEPDDQDRLAGSHDGTGDPIERPEETGSESMRGGSPGRSPQPLAETDEPEQH